jgi:hypothetical protein
MKTRMKKIYEKINIGIDNHKNIKNMGWNSSEKETNF